MACALNNTNKMMEDVEEGEKEEDEEEDEEAVATRMKEEMKKMIQERADELKAKRSEVINILVDVTQEFITRVRLVSANDTIPEEVLYNLDRAILICGRLQNDIRIIFGSNLSPLPQAHSASFGCSSQTGGGDYYYPNGLHPATPSPPESLQPDYYEQAAYKDYDQIDPDGKQIGNNQDEEHFYEKLCWPNKSEKRESSSDGTASLLYNNVVTQTALAAAVDPCFSDYDATGGNVPSITALLPGLNRAAARATHPEENQPFGPTGHGHVSNDTDQTIPNTNEPTIGANDAHQTIPNTLEGTFSTSDVNQTIPKTVEGTFSTSDVDQTIPKTVEGTFSTSDVNQTIRKTVEGTFSTSGVNQTIPKTVEKTVSTKDIGQTIPKTVEGTDSTSDVNQTIPKMVEGTDSTSDVNQTIPKTVEGTDSTSDVNQTIPNTLDGTDSTSDVNQTIPKTVDGTDSASDADQTIPKTVEKTVSTKDIGQTIPKTVEGTDSTSDVNQTIPKTVEGTDSTIDANQTIPKTVEQTVPKADIHQTIPKTVEETAPKEVTPQTSPEPAEQTVPKADAHRATPESAEEDCRDNSHEPYSETADDHEADEAFEDAEEGPSPVSAPDYGFSRERDEESLSSYGTPPTHMTSEWFSGAKEGLRIRSRDKDSLAPKSDADDSCKEDRSSSGEGETYGDVHWEDEDNDNHESKQPRSRETTLDEGDENNDIITQPNSHTVPPAKVRRKGADADVYEDRSTPPRNADDYVEGGRILLPEQAGNSGGGGGGDDGGGYDDDEQTRLKTRAGREDNGNSRTKAEPTHIPEIVVEGYSHPPVENKRNNPPIDNADDRGRFSTNLDPKSSANHDKRAHVPTKRDQKSSPDAAQIFPPKPNQRENPSANEHPPTPRDDRRNNPTADGRSFFPSTNDRRKSPDGEAHPHSSPERFRRDDPKADKHPNFPSKQDQRDNPEADLHPRFPPKHDQRDNPEADLHPRFPPKHDHQKDNPEADLHPRFPPKHDDRRNCSPNDDDGDDGHHGRLLPPPPEYSKHGPKPDHSHDLSGHSAHKHDRRNNYGPSPTADNKDGNGHLLLGVGAGPKTGSLSSLERPLNRGSPPAYNTLKPPTWSGKSSRSASNATSGDDHCRHQTHPKTRIEQQRIPDIWCQLGVISTTGYPAHVMFHGYKRRTQISTNAIKIYFDDVCSISEKLYDRNEGYFTAPYRGYYRFHLSLKADYPPDLNTEVNSSCTLRIVCGEENGSEDTYTWSDCTVKHSDWTQGGPDKAVSIYPKRYFRKGEHFTVQAIASTGVWFSVENFINLFILQSSS